MQGELFWSPSFFCHADNDVLSILKHNVATTTTLLRHEIDDSTAQSDLGSSCSTVITSHHAEKNAPNDRGQGSRRTIFGLSVAL